MSQLISMDEFYLSQAELDALLEGVTDDNKNFRILDELSIRGETWFHIRVNREVKDWLVENFNDNDFVIFPSEHLKLLVSMAIMPMLILKFN